MVLRYVLDEHFRRRLWKALQKHNLAGIDPVDVVRVGDPPDIPLGVDDPSLLLWAEREQLVLVTRDENTMPIHLGNHLSAGRHSPGVFMSSSEKQLWTSGCLSGPGRLSEQTWGVG